jgi:prolipoprotein diacylglyceryltransferase
MNSRDENPASCPGFPRYFWICGHWINSYKFFLCIGIYVGVLVSAAVAESAAVSPLRVGLGSLACAVAGLVGARLYHLLVFAPLYLRHRCWAALWNTERGGWSVFGALLTMTPCSFLVAAALQVPAADFWDYLGAGILAGGFWVRLGCVFNGCCCGRETTSWCGVSQHDILGQRKRRIPVQFLEMGWWLLGLAAFLALWPRSLPAGSWALGVLCWYGCGRCWLEPLRESPDLVGGRVRINQVVAALLAIAAGCGLILTALTN